MSKVNIMTFENLLSITKSIFKSHYIHVKWTIKIYFFFFVLLRWPLFCDGLLSGHQDPFFFMLQQWPLFCDGLLWWLAFVPCGASMTMLSLVPCCVIDVSGNAACGVEAHSDTSGGFKSLKLMAVVVILWLYLDTCTVCVCVWVSNKRMGDGQVKGMQSKKELDEVVHGGTDNAHALLGNVVCTSLCVWSGRAS